MKKCKYDQGIFKPIHPEKYIGNVNNIMYRSGLEKKYMLYFDNNTNVLNWSSEEVVIPYTQVDGTRHRYFVDFFVKVKTKDGTIKQFLVEIKPYDQCFPPKTPKRVTKAFKERIKTFFVNQSKWEAAKKSAEKNGMTFIILTERDL